MTMWRQKKMGRSQIFYSYGALLGDEAISIPQRRKYCNFPIFLLSNSTCPSWWISSESQRVFHHHMYKISINFIIPINTNFVMVFVLGKYCNIKLVCVWSLTKCTEDSCCPQYSLLSSYSQDCLDQLQGHCWNMLMRRYNQTNKDW